MMTPATSTNPRTMIAPWQGVLLTACIAGLVAGIALMAAPRRIDSPASPTATRVSVTEVFAAYDDLHLQRLAALQALRSGATENYEIAMSGATAIEGRIAALLAQQPATTELDRAIIDAQEQLSVQWLAAEQALRARQTENYEIAVAGAEALQDRIVDLRAQRPRGR